jgi:hypothetical protein
VFATAGRSGLTDRANDLVLDEVGTALNLVARAPRHDRTVEVEFFGEPSMRRSEYTI